LPQKLKQIPDEVMNRMDESSSTTTQNSPVNLNNISGSTSIRPQFDEPAILQSDPELEAQELMRKYNINQPLIILLQNQLEKFKALMGDENTNEPIQRIEINRNEEGQVQNGEVVVNNVQTIPCF
jgi:hypothetical protein